MTFLCNKKSSLFDRKEAKRIFDNNDKYLNCPINFDIIVNNDWFFTVMNDDGDTVGICYILMDMYNGKKVPFYSGAFDRKTSKNVKEAHDILLSIVFKKFKEIYTWTPHLHAKIFNKRMGMIELENNVYMIDKTTYNRRK